MSRTGASIASTAKDEAAALNGLRKALAYGATAGLNSIATLATCGAISLSSSNHLPASEPTIAWKPVTLPPGRARLATKPLPTGSETVAKTMGMVRVCSNSAAVVGVTAERIRSGCSATSSFANRRLASASSGVAHRVSNRILRASTHRASGWALADDREDSDNKSGDIAIKGCTARIRQNSRNAAAYNNRGFEYRHKSDLDRAIADYTKAIEINPRYADYNNRGYAYTIKGDFDRAI